jgi:hypothetical protein
VEKNTSGKKYRGKALLVCASWDRITRVGILHYQFSNLLILNQQQNWDFFDKRRASHFAGVLLVYYNSLGLVLSVKFFIWWVLLLKVRNA